MIANKKPANSAVSSNPLEANLFALCQCFLKEKYHGQREFYYAEDVKKQIAKQHTLSEPFMQMLIDTTHTMVRRATPTCSHSYMVFARLLKVENLVNVMLRLITMTDTMREQLTELKKMVSQSLVEPSNVSFCKERSTPKRINNITTLQSRLA